MSLFMQEENRPYLWGKLAWLLCDKTSQNNFYRVPCNILCVNCVVCINCQSKRKRICTSIKWINFWEEDELTVKEYIFFIKIEFDEECSVKNTLK